MNIDSDFWAKALNLLSYAGTVVTLLFVLFHASDENNNHFKQRISLLKAWCIVLIFVVGGDNYVISKNLKDREKELEKTKIVGSILNDSCTISSQKIEAMKLQIEEHYEFIWKTQNTLENALQKKEPLSKELKRHIKICFGLLDEINNYCYSTIQTSNLVDSLVFVQYGSSGVASDTAKLQCNRAYLRTININAETTIMLTKLIRQRLDTVVYKIDQLKLNPTKELITETNKYHITKLNRK